MKAAMAALGSVRQQAFMYCHSTTQPVCAPPRVLVSLHQRERVACQPGRVPRARAILGVLVALHEARGRALPLLVRQALVVAGRGVAGLLCVGTRMVLNRRKIYSNSSPLI